MEILIILCLVLLNGVFSMSEIALISSRKFKLEKAAKKGNIGARKALQLSDNPNTFLSTVQIGITLIGILTGIFSGEKITDNLTVYLKEIDILEPYAESLAVILIVIIITYLSIVFGELIPKRVGLLHPEKIASIIAHPMDIISGITKPFIWLLSKTNDTVFRIFGIKDSPATFITEEEIKSIVEESTRSGEIREIENILVKRVFELGDRKAGELMTHRSNIIWFDIDDNFPKIKNQIKQNPHTVYVVANDNLDNIKGTVSIKDLFSSDIGIHFSLNNYIRKPIYVLENSPVYQVLERFKSSGMQVAVVIDEYGSIQGVITLKDVLEAIVGDVIESQDEYSITQRDENSWLADGQLSYFDLLNYFEIEEKQEADGFNTLGGLILNELRHIPVEGEKITWNEFEFEVVDMDERRIDKVLIKRI